MYKFGQINTSSNEKYQKQIIPINNNFINENGNYILKVNKKEESPINKSFDQNINADKNGNAFYEINDRSYNKDHKEHKDHKDHKEHKEHKEYKEHKEHKEYKEPGTRTVFCISF